MDRASRSPPRICASEARGELLPPPTPRLGASAHVSTLAHSGPSLGIAGPEAPERVGQRRGKRPGRILFPLARNGRGAGRRPLPEAPAPRFPSAERKLPPPPAGLTWGRGGASLLAPLPPSRPDPDPAPQTKFRDPRPARGERLSPCWAKGGGRRGLHLSVPPAGLQEDGPGLHPVTPFLSPPPSVRPGLLGRPLPVLLFTPPSLVGSSWAGAVRSPRTPRPCRSTAKPRVRSTLPPVGTLKPDFLRIPPSQPRFPVPILQVPLAQGPSIPDSRRRGSLPGLGHRRPRPSPNTHTQLKIQGKGAFFFFFLNHRLAGLRDPLLKTPESSASLCLSPRFPACQSVAVNRDRVGKLPPPPTTRIKNKITVHFTDEEVGDSGPTTLPQLGPG